MELNEIQYEWTKARIDNLLPLVDDTTPEDDPNRIELEILSELGELSLVDVLKLRMHELGLTQKALAELIGVSPSREDSQRNLSQTGH